MVSIGSGFPRVFYCVFSFGVFYCFVSLEVVASLAGMPGERRRTAGIVGLVPRTIRRAGRIRPRQRDGVFFPLFPRFSPTCRQERSVSGRFTKTVFVVFVIEAEAEVETHIAVRNTSVVGQRGTARRLFSQVEADDHHERRFELSRARFGEWSGDVHPILRPVDLRFEALSVNLALMCPCLDFGKNRFTAGFHRLYTHRMNEVEHRGSDSGPLRPSTWIRASVWMTKCSSWAALTWRGSCQSETDIGSE